MGKVKYWYHLPLPSPVELWGGQDGRGRLLGPGQPCAQGLSCPGPRLAEFLAAGQVPSVVLK